jgi:peptidyl-prolyl cis-trans isomerase D
VAAVRQGPVNDSELETFTQRRWRDLDRPVSARVTHVVVTTGKTCDRAHARRSIERVAAALKPGQNVEAFRTAAKSIDVAPCERKVEDLDPVTPDGRTVGASEGAYVAKFAEAANALVAVGQQSGIVETEFGFHVLLLTERLPERRVSKEERRALLLGEVRRERGKAMMHEVLQAARAEVAPEVKSEANALMGLLQEVP